MTERPDPLHQEFLERPTYSFLHTVGVGTAGKSVLWTHDVLGRKVVSKTIDLFGLPGGLARSEPRLLEDMEHPRLVRVREAQWTPGYDPALKVVTFTTDFCEGLSVAAALAEGHQFSTREALTIVADVFDALAYLHEEQRLVHRDVKPGNIMLDAARGRGFVGDLGSAALLDDDGTVPAGGCTPLYQAPESVEDRVGQAVDIYGAGMVLLELLNGQPDFAALDYDKVDKRLAKGRRSMSDGHFTLSPWVPSNVCALVRALTARDHARRPSAAQALRRVRNTSCVDWRRTEGTGLTGGWEGQWPPTVPTARRRIFQVTAEPISSGRYKGRVHLRAAWRTPSTRWRNYASLARRVESGDGQGLAGFFRDVEAAAQTTPA